MFVTSKWILASSSSELEYCASASSDTEGTGILLVSTWLYRSASHTPQVQQVRSDAWTRCQKVCASLAHGWDSGEPIAFGKECWVRTNWPRGWRPWHTRDCIEALGSRRSDFRRPVMHSVTQGHASWQRATTYRGLSDRKTAQSLENSTSHSAAGLKPPLSLPEGLTE